MGAKAIEPLIDLIVPHYKEPWSTVEKFFNMLDAQRCADFSKFRVIFVNDGEENAFPTKNFSHRLYKVLQISIPHAGVSAARNEGLRKATAEWIMFCDCDDMFASPFAMLDILDSFRDPDLSQKVDLIWGDILIESRKNNIYGVKGFNNVFVHGKLFRRAYLTEHDIFFDESLSYSEDCLFVTTAYLLADEHRIAKIVSRLPIYVWCDIEGSVTNQNKAKDGAITSILYADKKICELYKKARPYDEYCCMIARTIIDAYFYFNRPNLSNALTLERDNFVSWYLEHEEQWRSVPKPVLRSIKDKSRNSLFMRKAEISEDISVTEWLNRITANRDV